jgi:predicted phage terminase large subunit-like protein
MPPGAAKSTYTSKAFPSWYLGRRPGNSILACSYSKDLAVVFGRSSRNYVETYEQVLGYKLSGDSRAADEWETSTGGRYFCAGVGAGIAGHRADLGLIDDYLGSQEDADSKTIRDKQYQWFIQDFYPRLKPTASIIIIANRRHEDDLVGRLLSTEVEGSPIRPDQWEVVRLPFFAEDNDPLGRAVGERLWPEWFTQDMADSVNRMVPRVKAGLYQQRPAPEEGDYFRREMLVGYTLDQLPKNLRIYCSSDHAVSEEDGANRTCLLPVGVDSDGVIWILPDVWWKKAGPIEIVDNFIAVMKRREPLIWWAEKGHISKSLGPFLRERMLEEEVYGYIQEVTPVRAKDVRARSIQGRMALGTVRFPKFASWWEEAEHELLTFPGGKSDDFVDALAHIGMGIGSLTKASKAIQPKNEDVNLPFVPTMKWLRRMHDLAQPKVQSLYGGR